MLLKRFIIKLMVALIYWGYQSSVFLMPLFTVNGILKLMVKQILMHYWQLLHKYHCNTLLNSPSINEDK